MTLAKFVPFDKWRI